MRNLKQALIWLRRFRCRCGYGVHSPFAFDFITNVVYEKTPYYAYQEIESRACSEQGTDANRINGHSKKVNRLLFRLVNRVQPRTIIHAGKPDITSDYLQAAKRVAEYIPLVPENIDELSSVLSVDFLYINWPDDFLFVEKLFEYAIERVGSRSMIVIRGIYCSSAMKAFWKQLVADERVGVTFDLYDLGILFFDRSKIKQHYIVNF